MQNTMIYNGVHAVSAHSTIKLTAAQKPAQKNVCISTAPLEFLHSHKAWPQSLTSNPTKRNSSMDPAASATPKRAWPATGTWHLRRECMCQSEHGIRPEHGGMSRTPVVRHCNLSAYTGLQPIDPAC